MKQLFHKGLSLLALAFFFILTLFTDMAKALLLGPAVSPQEQFTMDVAFLLRMGAGYPGDINRTHPCSVVPGLIDPTNPPRLAGDAVRVNTSANSYRGIIAGDQHDSNAIAIKGVAVRVYPTQQTSGGMASAIGAVALPATGSWDYMRSGFIMTKIPAGQVVTKDGAVWIWCTASTGGHIQGGFEGAADAGDTVPVSNARFTGPADADGNVEIEVWEA